MSPVLLPFIAIYHEEYKDDGNKLLNRLQSGFVPKVNGTYM